MVYPKFNGSHFGLPPSDIHRMTSLGGKMVWTMTYSYMVHQLLNVQVLPFQLSLLLRYKFDMTKKKLAAFQISLEAVWGLPAYGLTVEFAFVPKLTKSWGTFVSMCMCTSKSPTQHVKPCLTWWAKTCFHPPPNSNNKNTAYGGQPVSNECES